MKFLFAWLVVIPAVAFAQSPPSAWKPVKPVELIVSAAPGGANDRLARSIQRIAQDARLVPGAMNVVNRAGGGGSIMMNYLNSHPGDSHYLALASSSWLTTVAGGRSAITHQDVTPIAKLLDEPIVYFVKVDGGIKSAREMGERLKKDPASLAFGLSVGVGNPLHISIVNIARHVGGDPNRLKTVVFNSGAETATQVSGGHIDVGVQGPGSALALAQAGKVRLLAVASSQRLAAGLSDIPTLREQGIDVVGSSFFLILAPKGVDAAQSAYWEGVFSKVVQSDEFRKDLERNYWTADFLGQREAAAFMEQQYQGFRRTLLLIGLAK